MTASARLHLDEDSSPNEFVHEFLLSRLPIRLWAGREQMVPLRFASFGAVTDRPYALLTVLLEEFVSTGCRTNQDQIDTSQDPMACSSLSVQRDHATPLGLPRAGYELALACRVCGDLAIFENSSIHLQ